MPEMKIAEFANRENPDEATQYENNCVSGDLGKNSRVSRSKKVLFFFF